MEVANTNGVTLEYEVRGIGEPVALIHLSLYADSFAPLMVQHALAGYQLLRYHRRGYVGSSRTAGPVAKFETKKSPLPGGLIVEVRRQGKMRLASRLVPPPRTRPRGGPLRKAAARIDTAAREHGTSRA